MLQTESGVRLLEHQDEIAIEPCFKKMKSTEGAYEKLFDDYQGIQEKADAEKTSNDFIPACISDNQGQHEMRKQEEIPAGGVLGSVNEVLPKNSLVLSQLVDSETVQNVNPSFASINDSKVEEKTDPFITNSAHEDNIQASSTTISLSRNASDEEFFTSKVFIGPIYKPAEISKLDKSGSCNECSNSEADENELCESRAKRKEAKKTQTVSSVLKIDDELDQFYKEIHQLEDENLDTSVREKEIETSQEQYTQYICSQTSQEDYQGVLLGSSQPFYENGHGFFEEPNGQNTTSEQQFVVETSSWKTESTSNEQVNSKYLNSSVPEFRPAWQSAESFIVPQGPLPPTFTHQSNFLNAPPEQTSALPSHNELSYTYYYGYHGNTDNNSYVPSLDQSTNYAGHVDIPPTQVFRNAHNDPHRLHNKDLNGLQNNGLCETREQCWKDVKADNTEGMHSFSSLQLPEERFSYSDKVLLILRGLPGSGKSTLSRALLGQSCDGIVLSTDDYFCQQDGYTYNAAHLGDAHDWNQKRAKQAMEQGRSPVIIDNTNTQAWEMKPYVDMALEKGYRVEFHEPDTWWKFDPEELEKRNKHGVTRKKILQMLKQYEYQISIPIVMNSVAPPHKNTQRPPAERRPRVTILKKNPGHLLTKAKEGKKRKRNSKTKSNCTEIRKKMSDGTAHNPTPDDQNTAESEENDLEEEKNKSYTEHCDSPEDPETVCEEQHNNGNGSLKKAAVFSEETSPVVVSEVSMRSNSPLKNELPAGSDSSLLIDVKPFSTEILTKTAFDDEESNQRHKENVCRSSFLKIDNDKNSIQETEGISEDYSALLLSTQTKLGSYQITCEPDMEANLLSLNGEEKEVSRCYDSNVHNNIADSNTEDKDALEAEENSSNAWTVLSAQVPTEELQLGFDTQVSLSWSEDKFVGEQSSPKMRKPKQTHANNSTQRNCCQSNEGLMKGNHEVPVTGEAVSVISNALLASPAGEVQLDALVEAMAPFMQCSSEVNVQRNDVASPAASRRKRHRRIVSLAPKFNLPRQIAGSTEGEQEVPVKDVPQNSVLEVGQESFLSQDHREECDQGFALQECSAPYTGTKSTYSSSTPDAGALSHEISCIHSEQPSMPKYSCGLAVVISRTEEQARTLEQQKVVDRKEDESEQISSEVTNGQTDILSSVQVVSEHPENSSTLASCSDHVHEADPEPAEASQLEDNTEVNMKCSFLGLPLSLGFAFQLVQLFGSPGLPLGSLLPDDYIVPLDWKVSKMIYLLWKTSVEEKQKANGLQNEHALADDLNKNCQENQESSETLAEMEPRQDPTEEKIMTYTSTDCVDDVFHQS